MGTQATSLASTPLFTCTTRAVVPAREGGFGSKTEPKFPQAALRWPATTLFTFRGLQHPRHTRVGWQPQRPDEPAAIRLNPCTHVGSRGCSKHSFEILERCKFIRRIELAHCQQHHDQYGNCFGHCSDQSRRRFLQRRRGKLPSVPRGLVEGRPDLLRLDVGAVQEPAVDRRMAGNRVCL
jgi:hypothetical protein